MHCPSKKNCGERGGLVVERRTPNLEVLGLISTRVTMLCPRAKHINSLEYWIKPRKRWLRPDTTDNVDWGVKPQYEQTNKTVVI